MRRIFATMLLLPVLTAALWGQSGVTSVFIMSGSKTDQPAKPGQASDAATAAAQYLEDRIAIEIQDQYPCAKATEDRDIATLLKWEHDHSLLDSNYQSDLANIAGAVGAKYLITATATQLGGQFYMQATCMDTRSARSVEKADKQASARNAVNSAESLARDFVKSLSRLFAVKLESGKTYPAGTVFPAVSEASYRQHARHKSTYTKALAWVQRLGEFEKPGSGGSGELQCNPPNWGDCGGCTTCTCSGSCTIKLRAPGRYRLVNYTESIDAAERKVETVADITIEGSCKK